MKSILAILLLAASSVAFATTDKPADKPAVKAEGKAKAAEAPKSAGTSVPSTKVSKDAAKPDGLK